MGLVMSHKQVFAILTPPVLVAVMILVLRLLVNHIQFNWRVGWALGLAFYWLTWCGIGSWLLIGRESILRLVLPQKLTLQISVLVLIPITLAGLYRLVSGMSYEKHTLWIIAI